MAAWAFCATEHYPLPLSSLSTITVQSFSQCPSSMPFLFGLSYPAELQRGDCIYSSLKSEPIMSTDVTDREEAKRELRKYIKEWAEGERYIYKTRYNKVCKKKGKTFEEHSVFTSITKQYPNNEQMQRWCIVILTSKVFFSEAAKVLSKIKWQTFSVVLFVATEV